MYEPSIAGVVPLLLGEHSQIARVVGAANGNRAATSGQGHFRERPVREARDAECVRSIIKARALRRELFDGDLFADPAWDMLLELYALTCEGVRISVSKLSFAAGVPATTASRWIDKLEAERLVVRSEDPLDARRIWIALSDSGYSAMELFVERIAR
jgi:DNA-binding MarR family transcriptional regulator